MSDLKGKVAIVTGASKGIGAEIARQLAANGAAVAVNYASSREGAERTVADIVASGGRAIAVGGDVSQDADADRIVAETIAEFGRLDILVNNAAYFSFGPVEGISLDDFRRHYEVNVYGIVAMVRAASPHLGQGASIINIGSAGTVNPIPNAILYAGSKAALDRTTQFLSRELGPRGIRVNVVRPGATDTEGNRRIGTLDNDEAVKVLIEHTSLRRFGVPADVAPAVVFLASDDAGWITGAILDASGGFG